MISRTSIIYARITLLGSLPAYKGLLARILMDFNSVFLGNQRVSIEIKYDSNKSKVSGEGEQKSPKY